MLELYDVLIVAHALCFVYWLGGDLGVFYSSGIVIKPGLSKETRVITVKIFHWLDQFPRVCMPLVAALGTTMANLKGWFQLSSVWLFVVWIIAIVWIFNVIYIFIKEESSPRTELVRKVDFVMRWVLSTGIALLAIMSFAGSGITQDVWLAAKLLIYSGTIFLGIISRLTMKPFGPAFKRILNDGDTTEDLEILRKTLLKTRIPILGIWFLVFLAGAIGIIKPF